MLVNGAESGTVRYIGEIHFKVGVHCTMYSIVHRGDTLPRRCILYSSVHRGDILQGRCTLYSTVHRGDTLQGRCILYGTVHRGDTPEAISGGVARPLATP